MNRLVLNDQGFVDLRRNPPAEKDQVNGWTPGEEKPKVETVPVEFPKTVEDTLPAIQKTAEGLDRPSSPVRVEKEIKGKNLKRIIAVDKPECYVIVTPQQFEELGKFEWRSNRTGHLYRRDEKGEVRWLHRDAAKCRSDRFVAFRSGDQRDCRPSNLRVVATKDKLKELKMAVRRAAGK